MLQTTSIYVGEQVVEYRRRYDGGNVDVEGCQITEANEGVTCTFDIEVDE